MWTEDDATLGTEGHEGLGAAWRRLFGEDLSRPDALHSEDGGDSTWHWMPNGHLAIASYPGNSEIRKWR